MKKRIFAYLYDPLFDDPIIYDFTKIDVVNYSFGKIEDGKVTIKHLKNLDKVFSVKHDELKIVLSIGGWGADGFSEGVKTRENRTILIDSILDLINQYHFDGVDLDWEYPTSSVGGITSSPDDKENFTFFLSELRKAMDEVNPELILTIAVGAGGKIPNYIEVEKLSSIIDYLHIMTYDMMNLEKNFTDHHTNLYGSVYKCDISANLVVNTYHQLGMPIEKIVIGAAFYGHYATTAPSETNGIGLPCLTPLTQAMSYTEIKTKYLNNPNFKHYFDEEAKASWLFDGTTFISYDDETSIFFKCLYIKSRNLAGIMFWQLTGDKTGTLLDTIYTNLKA
jgi:chitinase